MKYETTFDGAIVSPLMNKPFKFMCCDCGLVHKLMFRVLRLTKRKKNGYWEGKRVRGHKVQFRAFRDNRATAATRKRKGGVITLRRK